MNVELKAGTLSDFFASAKETAKEIDSGEKVTRKNTIWVDSIDLMAILKPERTRLVKYLRKKKRVVFSELMSKMKRTPVSALLLHSYQKKQENHAAIFKRFSVDAANNAFKAFANCIPLIVTLYLFCLGSLRIIP